MSIKDDLAYLRSISSFIALTTFVFFLTSVMGYWAAGADPDLASQWRAQLDALRWILEQPPQDQVVEAGYEVL